MEKHEEKIDLDITVEQIIKVLAPKKRIFIKPYGNRTYYEGKSNEIPNCLLKLKVNELVPKICKDDDPFAAYPYYTEVGIWVEEIPLLEERMSEDDTMLNEGDEFREYTNKFENIVISGEAGSGKTRECKSRIIELLKDSNNRVAVYCEDHDYSDLEKIFPSLIIKNQCEENENLIDFFAWFKNTARNDFLEWNKCNYYIFIDCFIPDGFNVHELAGWIRKLNNLNISVCLLVKEYNEIFCDADNEKFKSDIAWLKENFTEINMSRKKEF